MYKTNTAAQLWTQIGNKAGTTTVGAVIVTSGVSAIIKERRMWEISSANYAGKYIEPKYLDYVDDVAPEPNTESIVIAAHSVQVEIAGVAWEYWYPQVTLERVG